MRGYTLIEILAIIVIIAIILLIAVPMISNVIESTRKQAFILSTKNIINSAEFTYANNSFERENELVFLFEENKISGNYPDIELKFNGKIPLSGNLIIREDGEIATSLFNGEYCAVKDYTEEEVSIVDLTQAECYSEISLPSIVLNGSNPENIEIKTMYIDQGAYAETIAGIQITDIAKKILKNNIEVSNVDTDSIGNYRIIYTVYEGAKTNYVEREVNVVDTTKPNITIPNNNNITIAEIDSLDLMDGVSVIDNSGETLTVSVVGSIAKIAGSYNITYTATDSSGNTENVIRTINVSDTSAPVLALNGSATIFMNLGDTYTELGATAIDDSEGDITSSITKNGGVNTAIAGTYYITYSAQDSSGNEGNITRTVIIIEKIIRDFAYTGNYQAYTVPYSGLYLLETWGAQGGKHINNTTVGGKGAYAKGNLYLEAGTTIYVYVGGKGGDATTTNPGSGGYNGGGQGGYANGAYGANGSGGGGSTDFRTTTSINDRILIAGGGGGAGPSNTQGLPGYGGTFVGGNPAYYTNAGSPETFYPADPGTQTAGGRGGSVQNGLIDIFAGAPGSKLNGGAGFGDYSTSDAGSGGGGGYYGGGGGSWTRGGAGGSSYTGTVSNAAMTADNNLGNGKAKLTMLSAAIELDMGPQVSIISPSDGVSISTLINTQLRIDNLKIGDTFKVKYQAFGGIFREVATEYTAASTTMTINPTLDISGYDSGLMKLHIWIEKNGVSSPVKILTINKNSTYRYIKYSIDFIKSYQSGGSTRTITTVRDSENCERYYYTHGPLFTPGFSTTSSYQQKVIESNIANNINSSEVFYSYTNYSYSISRQADRTVVSSYVGVNAYPSSDGTFSNDATCGRYWYSRGIMVTQSMTYLYKRGGSSFGPETVTTKTYEGIHDDYWWILDKID